MRFDTAVRVDYTACERRLLARCAAAERALGGAVLTDCGPYVPYDTGRLAGSAEFRISEDAPTQGTVSWNVPYAAAVYYGDARGVRFSREKHPHACARWFEAAKSTALEAWTEKTAQGAAAGLRSAP